MEEGCFYCKCFLKDNDKLKKKSSVSDIPGCKDHLHNWERWLNERRHINETLSKRLKRPKDHLLMNATEEERKIVEEKILFVNDNNYAYFDKYRGNPEWFKLRPRLRKRCKNDPILEAVVLKDEKREVVPIEYVETPTRILREKDIFPRTRNGLTRWQKGAYRQEVFKRIRKTMKFLEPHKPKLSEIIVTGTKIGGPKKINENLCTDTCKETNLCTNKDCYTIAPVYKIQKPQTIACKVCESISITQNSTPSIALKINGIDITPAVIEKGKMTIRILFISNMIPKKPLQKSIIFENYGSTTLRIQFHYQQKFRTFRDIIPDFRISPPFYFNKDEIILLPFHKIDLPLWFKTSKAGNFVESWKITTTPKLWTEKFVFTVSLQGIVYKDDHVMSNAIQDMLDSRVRYTLVRDIIKDIIDTTKLEQSQSYTYTYTEKDLFESINMEKWGCTNRPKYLYDKEIIKHLKQLYYNVRCNEDPPHWDYCVKTLKEVVRKRDVLDFIDNLYKECMNVKGRAEVLKEMYDSPPSMQQQKGDGDKTPLDEVKIVGHPSIATVLQDINHPSSDHKITYAGYHELNTLLQKLERVVMIPNVQRSKYASAFFIGRFYLNKISSELDNYSIIESLTNVNYNRVKRIEDLPERLIFERFDDIWANKTRMVKMDTTVQNLYPAKPKPKYLEDIPSENYELVSQMYVTRQISTENKRKKEIAIARAARKSKLSHLKSSINTEREVEGFDPYAETLTDMVIPTYVAHQKKFQHPEYASESINSLVASTKSYQEKYLIIYTNLCSAVDALVNAIETMSEKKIPIPTLGELARCKVVKTETTYLEKPLTPIESRIDNAPDEYYQYLIDTYLKDPKTQDYFIGDKTVPPVEKLQEFFSINTSNIRLDRGYPSMEFLISEVRESDRNNVGVQTSETEDFLSHISNILIRPDMQPESYTPEDLLYIETELLLDEQAEAETEGEASKDNFYIVESDVSFVSEGRSPSTSEKKLW